MLTKKDLLAISKLLDEKFAVELRPIWKELRKLRRDLKTTINVFDGDLMNHDKRISRIESHLELAPL